MSRAYYTGYSMWTVGRHHRETPLAPAGVGVCASWCRQGQRLELASALRFGGKTQLAAKAQAAWKGARGPTIPFEAFMLGRAPVL